MVEAQGRRILLIHDDAPTLATLQQALQQAQFQVNGAPSSPAAVRDLRQVQPDVVICKNKMPMLGGRHVIRAVSGVDEDIPVILLMAERDLGLIVELLRAGAMDCVVDPLQEVDALVDSAERAAGIAARRKRTRHLEEELKKAQTRMSRLLEQEAVIRERAFQKVEDPLQRAIRNLTNLGRAPLAEEHQTAVRAILADVYDVSDRLQSAQTDASRTSTRSVALEDFHPLAIAEFFRDAVIKRAHASGAEVAYLVPPELPGLRGDPEQLRSVLVDLGSFLLDRGLMGVLHLKLEILERGRGPWLVRFEVSGADAPDFVRGANVIDKYLPGDDVATVREELIDLSRAARVVDLLGSELEMFESIGGLRFQFELGLLPAKRQTELPGPGLAVGEVVVADPTALMGRCIANELTKLGMRVATASSAAQAAGMVQRATASGAPPAVVFISLSLPDREVLEAQLPRGKNAKPARVYLGGAGEVAPEDDDALFLLRPPRRNVLIEVLKRTVGKA